MKVKLLVTLGSSYNRQYYVSDIIFFDDLITNCFLA